LADYAQKNQTINYAMLLYFLLLVIMLWVGLLCPLTGYFAWALINFQFLLLTDLL